jgi:hypothetical protein
LESLCFAWNVHDAIWEQQLSELASYQDIHGHCNVPHKYSENRSLGTWVGVQKAQYKLRGQGGRKTYLSDYRVQALESLGFAWNVHDALWEQQLSVLADDQHIRGHCNVPKEYSENRSLGWWVGTQRAQYKSRGQDGRITKMTDYRVQALESLGFVWNVLDALWELRFSELVDFQHIHEHCKVPHKYSENRPLGTWVTDQRTQYKLRGQDGRISNMTDYRVQALSGLCFAWTGW